MSSDIIRSGEINIKPEEAALLQREKAGDFYPHPAPQLQDKVSLRDIAYQDLPAEIRQVVDGICAEVTDTKIVNASEVDQHLHPQDKMEFDLYLGGNGVVNITTADGELIATVNMGPAIFSVVRPGEMHGVTSNTEPFISIKGILKK